MIRRTPNRVAGRIDLFRVTLLVIVFLTGVPAFLRPLGQRAIYWGYQPIDIIVNVLLYLPLGFFQYRSTSLTVAARAALLSTSIEAIQLISAYRFPGPADIVSNTLGALLGHFIARRFRLDLQVVRAKRFETTLSLILATVCLILGQRWAAIHAMGHEIAPNAQVLGLGFCVGLIATTLLQRPELELRLFTSAVVGFAVGRFVLAIGVYPSLGYSLPVLGALGGLLATWATRSIERFQTTE